MKQAPTRLQNIIAAAPLLVVAALAAGCGPDRKRSLLEALETYNDAVRWGRTELAAQYLPRTARDKFIRRRGERVDVQVTHCEMTGLQMAAAERAVALVRIDWYSLRRARVHRTVMRQVWAWRQETWKVTEQHWVSGAPFPL